MAQVVWTDEALANLDAIQAYIEQFNPLAAQQMAMRLIAVGNSLVEMPDRGRAVGGGSRELANVHPYLIRYRVAGDAIVILRIRHGARRP